MPTTRRERVWLQEIEKIKIRSNLPAENVPDSNPVFPARGKIIAAQEWGSWASRRR